MNVDCFCLIHEGRCGSTVLGSLLNQHPEVAHLNEILTEKSWISKDFVGSEWELKRDSRAIDLGNLPDFIRVLPGTESVVGKRSCRYIGFEIKLNQLSEAHLGCDVPTLVDTLEAKLGTIRFIFLTRRNILRRHVSTLRALLKGVSHAEDLRDVNFEKVRVDHETMRDWSYDFFTPHSTLTELLASSEARRRAVRAFAEGRGDLYLEYEDFAQAPLSGANRIVKALGLSPVQAESPWLRTGDKPLADLIENYEEVRSALENTRWAPMLE